MNTQEKALARQLFKVKIHEANGDKFEDIFTSIYSYVEKGFQQIKPWGNIGDRKNDGYIAEKGIYFQVYAPEEIKSSYPSVVKKLTTDFSGLKKQWPDVKEFYFVVNDKYQGVNADSDQTIKEIVKSNSLDSGGFLTAKDLERLLFTCSDDEIITVSGFLPDVNSITSLDYTTLSEVIGYIMKLPMNNSSERIELPDWNAKIAFNKLSETTKLYLNLGAQKLGALNTYLSNQSFLADDIRDRLSSLYYESKGKSWEEQEFIGDLIFWDIVKQCSPKNESHYESAIMTIVAKYFESCDVFEKNPDIV
ncbi:MAG: hypothetical protein BGO31_13080 [Bacteroidetes bacterium 43-16]|nr:MAG: hypothetical protein BGO31_13080 [Bacteroidetes bacterium 43-16]